MATTAAFFDLDKTVIAKSSTLAFGKPFYKAGFLGRRTLMKVGFGQLFYVLFGADHDTLERARDQMLELTAGWHRAEIEQLVEETLEEVADPLVYAEALTLIEVLRPKTFDTVLPGTSLVRRFFTLHDNDPDLKNPRLSLPLQIEAGQSIAHTINRGLIPVDL